MLLIFREENCSKCLFSSMAWHQTLHTLMRKDWSLTKSLVLERNKRQFVYTSSIRPTCFLLLLGVHSYIVLPALVMNDVVFSSYCLQPQSLVDSGNTSLVFKAGGHFWSGALLKQICIQLKRTNKQKRSILTLGLCLLKWAIFHFYSFLFLQKEYADNHNQNDIFMLS